MFWLPGTHLGRCAGNGSAICHRRTVDHRKRKVIGAKIPGTGHLRNPPPPSHLPTHPKELTTCHLKPAHCFYSMQMFSSVLSPVSPPPLPFYPHSPSQTFFFFFNACVNVSGGAKGLRWRARSSLTLDLVCLFCFFVSGIEIILSNSRLSLTSFTLTPGGLRTFGPAIVFLGLKNCSIIHFQNSRNPYSGLCLHV